MRQELLSDMPLPEKNWVQHGITTEGSFEVEDFSPPESPEADISVMEDYGGLELSRINLSPSNGQRRSSQSNAGSDMLATLNT